MSARNAVSGSTEFPWKWYLKDLEPPAEGAPKVFSTFACGGGSSMGYKLAGYEVVGNVEIDPRVAEVYDRNLHPKRSYVMDIRDFNELEDLPDELFDLDVLDGSPPCSSFSTQGSRHHAWGMKKRFAEGQKLQRLDDLFFAFLDTVAKLKPRAFIAENVLGLVAGKAKGYVHEILETASDLGYAVQVFQLNASVMGVPQDRTRIVFVGNRMGWPKLRMEFNDRPIKFGEVRSDRGGDPIGETLERYMAAYRPGDRDFGRLSERVVGKKTQYSTRIAADHEVAPTLTTCPIVRVCDRRFMSTEDVISISTFPQDYDFGGVDPVFVCGMSVPPVMMARIASEVKRQWLQRP